jgi:hypothetical protein
MIDLIASAVLLLPADAGTHSVRPATIVERAAEIPRSMRAWADCVARRESHHNPRARNPRSSAQGRYQFLDRLWRESLAGQVAARLRDHGMPRAVAADVRQYLSRREIARWPALYQDAGFIEVTLRGGARHWYLPGSACNKFAPN